MFLTQVHGIILNDSELKHLDYLLDFAHVHGYEVEVTKEYTILCKSQKEARILKGEMKALLKNLKESETLDESKT